MLQATQTRQAGTAWVDAAYEGQQRRRLVIAIVVLLAALAIVLVKDRELWFGDAETASADDAQTVSAPSTASQAPTAAGTEAKRSVQPAAVIPASRAAAPPRKIAGDQHRTVHLSNSSVKSANPAGASWGPATTAAQRAQIATDQAEPVQKPADSLYPVLTQQMSVQGSVLLQALIGADGVVEDLRVLSGPSILASAARKAVLQWRFKPYLQNGKPVETQARVTVNFTIKVLNNTARYQVDTVTSNGAL
jgi:TonB family protein